MVWRALQRFFFARRDKYGRRGWISTKTHMMQQQQKPNTGRDAGDDDRRVVVVVDDDDDDDVILATTRKTMTPFFLQPPRLGFSRGGGGYGDYAHGGDDTDATIDILEEEEDDDDLPISQLLPLIINKKRKRMMMPTKKVAAAADDDDDDDDLPISRIMINKKKTKVVVAAVPRAAPPPVIVAVTEEKKNEPQLAAKGFTKDDRDSRERELKRHGESPPVQRLLACALPGQVTRDIAKEAAQALIRMHLPIGGTTTSAARPILMIDGVRPGHPAVPARAVTFAFNDRLSRAQGRCRWILRLSTIHIELNGSSLSQCTGKEVYLTLLHEIGHALSGHKAAHTQPWKVNVFRIGGQPVRCCSRPNLILRSRLACHLHPHDHIVARALTAKPRWKRLVSSKCPFCADGRLTIVRLGKQ